MLISIIFLALLSFSKSLYASEIILICNMNYGISGENDETDIEFKNLSIGTKIKFYI